jgi:hypothetical protein
VRPSLRRGGVARVPACRDEVDASFAKLGDANIGRIYERHGFPDAVRFFWSLHGVVLTRPPDIHTDGHMPSLEAAKAEFKSNWLRWLEWSERAEVE